MHAELFDELREQGFDVQPGQLGENITTRGLDLLALPGGTRLRIGATDVVDVTGLRNPCAQLTTSCRGWSRRSFTRGADGSLVRKAGVMGVVTSGGEVAAGDAITVELPEGAHEPLDRV